MEFTKEIRDLVDGPNFATVATLGSDGSPHTSLIWVGLDGDAVVFSALASRQKVRNLRRDPRISITVSDAQNPYRSADLRGVAEILDDPDKELSLTLSRKYTGGDPPPEPAEKARVIVRLVPDKVTGFFL